MRNSDITSMAIRNLFKRKLRTSLTVLGVVIGTACIVLMIAIGLGVNLSVQESMAMMGDVTLIEIYNWDGYNNPNSGVPALDDAFIEYIESVDGVQVATPIAQTYGVAVSKRYRAELQIMGIRPEAMAALGYEAAEGRLLEAGDEYQIVFGTNAPYEFMTDREREQLYNSRRSGGYSYEMGGETEERDPPNIDIYNDRITFSYDWMYGQPSDPDATAQPGQKKADVYTINGVGVLAQGERYESQYYSFMHIDAVSEIIADRAKWEADGKPQETNGYEQGFVKCESIDDVEYVTEMIEAYGFTNVYSPMSSLEGLQQITGSLQGFLGIIGGVAMFIAVVGITNTMYMAIYERTKEIGVMKVIGAALRDIRKLFLTEAALIGLIGGVLGVGFSYLIAFVLNNVDVAFLSMFSFGGESSTVAHIPPWLAASALGISVLIGLISGYLPARRAMRISALHAIRSD